MSSQPKWEKESNYARVKEVITDVINNPRGNQGSRNVKFIDFHRNLGVPEENLHIASHKHQLKSQQPQPIILGLVTEIAVIHEISVAG